MTNLQLIDSANGGYLVFKNKDYLLDEGIYSELYTALFSTQSVEWLLDSAFDLETPLISSKTQNSIKTNSTFTESSKSNITKALKTDLDRFTAKNPEIQIEEYEVSVESANRLIIYIEIQGYSDVYSFVIDKTEESLINIS